MRTLLSLVFMALVVPALSVAYKPSESAEAPRKSDVPEAVLKAFQKSFPGLAVTSYDSEIVNGRTHYEIETTTGESEKSYIYLEDGTLLWTEVEIPIAMLPKTVLDAVLSQYADCEIEEAEKIERSEATEYELVIEVDEEEYEVVVSSDGRIVTSDQMDDDAEDDSDDEENDDVDDEDEEG